MDRYIGIDVHATSCTIVVVGPTGRKLSQKVVQTTGPALLEYIKSIPKPRHVCLEEGNQSAWLYHLLSPYVDELVVAGRTQKRKGQKDDARDALTCAQQLRTGVIEKIVFKAPDRYSLLRQLAFSYDRLVSDTVRTRCRLKATYRACGIPASSNALYTAAHRDEWMSKLPVAYRPSVALLYSQLDAQRELRDSAEKQMVTESHRYPISRLLETCPGLGPIRVAMMIPVVVTPDRFGTVRQFWSYCGLGILMRTSSDWTQQDGRWIRAPVNQTRGLTKTFNHRLKYLFKSAATTVRNLYGSDHPLRQHYDKMVAGGVKPNLATLTLARQIAAIALAMWKHKEKYDPARHRKP
jgi:transposase